ncbi:Hpt domain-containing protein [Desulforhopalus singaporensis]|uniref:Hpt domain-containing protein n=1 Tax=Desulforhopalus singaporensis TaxID=91360 RepID=A0A1H0P333_9BACT|nr:Hpt domain-containing protein [Desulforhopalus singaporensis]SDO99373.1 Hpt domain-containing protein [Desulforhopalus singaporensis]
MSVEQIRQHLASQYHLTESQIAEMLPRFLETLCSHMDDVEEALKNNDYKRLGEAGHKIKGAFLNLGLEENAKKAFVLEKIGKEVDTESDCGQLAAELRAAVDSLLA